MFRLPRHLAQLVMVAALSIGLNSRTSPVDAAPSHVQIDNHIYGVEIHFTTGHESDLDRIAASGFKYVRMDLRWDETEKKRGFYTWRKWDVLMAHLRRRHLNAVLILDYSNKLYAPLVVGYGFGGKPAPESPRTTTTIDAFARWAAAAVRHFRSERVVWELYNEPNNPLFWEPLPDPEAYGRLVSRTCGELKKSDLKPELLAGATAYIDFRYMDAFMKVADLSCISGISVHPYAIQDPEGTEFLYDRLQRLVKEDSGKPLPIFDTEAGYSTNTFGESESEQADFSARLLLINLISGVRSTIIYEWKDDGKDVTDREQNLGLLRLDGKEKPAVIVLRRLAATLAGADKLSNLPMADRADYAVMIHVTGSWIRTIVWTARAKHYAIVPLPKSADRAISVVQLDGRSARVRRLTPLTVELSADPVVISFR